MFMGEYNHSIDAKGRLIVPAKFREQLGETFVVTKGLDSCLFVYPNSEWELIQQKFHEMPSTSKDARMFARFFFAGAAECELDKQGRILLPKPLLDHAHLTKDVVLAGVMNRVEIWDSTAWAEGTTFDDMDEVAQRLSDIGLII